MSFEVFSLSKATATHSTLSQDHAYSTWGTGCGRVCFRKTGKDVVWDGGGGAQAGKVEVAGSPHKTVWEVREFTQCKPSTVASQTLGPSYLRQTRVLQPFKS
jgi:hypothetical protein